MNFQQLRIIRESARCNYNLTDVASMLFTSQSGVSRHIRELEDELGVEIFIRRGKRLIGMMELGKTLLSVAERILNEANNIRRIADVFANKDSSELSIVTTHTQARYSLPGVIKQFRELYPRVRLMLNQGSPEKIVAMLQSGDTDVGIASEKLMTEEQLAAFPYYHWYHAVLVPEDHELTRALQLTLETLSRYPLITYRHGITGRSRIDVAFQVAGLHPEVVISAQDSDVIKTYVELGLEVGLLADMSYNRERDTGLVSLSVEHLFEANTVWLGVKRGQLQRKYAWRLIQLCNPQLSLTEIEEAVFSTAAAPAAALDYQIERVSPTGWACGKPC